MVETAKVNGQEPSTSLRHVLERLPHAQSVAELLTRNIMGDEERTWRYVYFMDCI
ncbi:hypothetical protein D3C72_2463310 [compost metagenome]